MHINNPKDCHYSPKYLNMSLSLFLAIKLGDHSSGGCVCDLFVWSQVTTESHISITSALYIRVLAQRPSSLAEWLATLLFILRSIFRVRICVFLKLWFDLCCHFQNKIQAVAEPAIPSMSWLISRVQLLGASKQWEPLRLTIFGSARVAQPSRAKLRQHYTNLTIYHQMGLHANWRF